MIPRGINFFSASPLNYENLQKRLVQFRRWKNPASEALRDYIRATRKLQLINRLVNPSYSSHSSGIDLDLKLNVSSTQLERELWKFLKEHWPQVVAEESIVKEYVLTSDSVDISHAFELVTKNYAYNVSKGQSTVGPVQALMHVLLRRNDYHGCFKAIDVTLSTEQLQQMAQRNFNTQFFAGALILASVAAFQWAFTPLLPFPLLALVDLTTIYGTMYGFYRINNWNAGRVSWRPHTSLLYRYTHHKEILAINKIVTYFEEYNEVNVKNYHISRVRNVSSLGTFHQDDYELELPGENSLSISGHSPDEKVEALARYFRSELSKRKIVWNPLKEERMFIEFWVSHGENFEWVEPDQDPAEMMHFRDGNK